MVKLKYICGHLVVFCGRCRREEKIIPVGQSMEIATFDFSGLQDMNVTLGLQFDAFLRKHKTCAMPVITRIGERESFR